MSTLNIRPSVFDCGVIDLPKIQNRAGNITVVENFKQIPFEVRRVFYIYDIPGGESRGGHAHKECHEFLIATSGCFEVDLDDGIARRTIMLSRPYHGLHLPPGIWATEKNYSSGAVCLVLTSHLYDEKDYLRNYDSFLKFRKQLP